METVCKLEQQIVLSVVCLSVEKILVGNHLTGAKGTNVEIYYNQGSCQDGGRHFQVPLILQSSLMLSQTQ